MKKDSKVAIVCCSNGQLEICKEQNEILKRKLIKIGLTPVFSDYIYATDGVFNGSAKDKAANLMKFYKDDEIKAIYDISGGDVANEILPYLDFDCIARSRKHFWGYSDLTTIINAIYTKTGVPSALYQVRNLIYADTKNQTKNFVNTVFKGTDDLFKLNYSFIQKRSMQGIVVGGNVRCLLKLAGTEYWPDMTGKLLLIEAYGGLLPQMTAYLSQLQQMGVFEKVNGIILGTFTKIDEEGSTQQVIDMVKKFAGKNVPIAKTDEIGHGINSKGIVIGRKLTL